MSRLTLCAQGSGQSSAAFSLWAVQAAVVSQLELDSMRRGMYWQRLASWRLAPWQLLEWQFAAAPLSLAGVPVLLAAAASRALKRPLFFVLAHPSDPDFKAG